MKGKFTKIVVGLFVSALIYIFSPSQILAQYGTYSCFGSGATGGCKPSTTNSCTNGGVVPNPTQCNGLSPSECNSATFNCNAPGTYATEGQSCASIPCALGLNCIDSVCEDSSPGIPKVSDLITCTGSCTLLPCAFGPASGSCVLSVINCCSNSPSGLNYVPNSGPPIENGCIKTAIGCIPVEDEQNLALFLLGWGMGLGGGIALILIVFSTYSIITSAGDPRKMQSGKELLYAALTGLGLLVSAAYLLRFIGVDILGIFGG